MALLSTPSNRLSNPGLAAVALCLGACCGAPPNAVEPAEASTDVASDDAATAAGAAAEPQGPPKLVVAVVLDQMGSWVFERYLPHLEPDGFLRKGTEKGRWYRRVVFPYASTFTAPGHAAIFTGKAPIDSGIVTNTIFDPATETEMEAVTDPDHAIIGRPGHGVSPKNLRVPTVGDALEEQHPDAKVYTLSLKDRAAILPGGKKADLAVWYEWKIPGFTSSTYYGADLPGWLESWLKGHPLANLMRPWEPADPRMLERLAGDDEGPGEGDYLGFGTTFPHDPSKALRPWSVLRITPQLSEYTVSLARAIVEGAELGVDDTVDLMSISISGLDYTGHTFGPGSWEYIDHLRRVDAALAGLAEWLEDNRGSVRFLVTADHGVTPTPKKNPDGGGRLFPDAVTELAKKASVEAADDPDLVSRYVRPFVYLKPGLSPEQRKTVVAAVAKKLTAHPGIRLAVDVRRAITWRDDPDPLRRAIGLSVTKGGPGDLYVVPEEHWVVDEDRPTGFGTTHGTPWKNDREVPVVIWGPGIEVGVHDEELSQLRVAPTLSALLGAKPPTGVTESPLPGAPISPGWGAN